MSISHLHHNSIFIDLDALSHNLEKIQTSVPGKRVMGIVKKNAYGHGLVEVGRALAEFGIAYLGVIYPEEGLELRAAGVTVPVLVMGATLPSDLPACIDHDLEFALLSSEHLKEAELAASRLQKTASVHLKVDTGMGRIGVRWDACADLLREIKQASRVEVKAVFSHLASADLPGNEFTTQQVTRFSSVLACFEEVFGYTPAAHLAASGGILSYPETHFDLVRPGHLLYGVLPDTALEDQLDLRPVLSLQTKIVFSKKVRKGDPVGYGNQWIAERDTHIATLSVGYGDGYPRKLTGKGAKVIINGAYFPVVGTVCMDQTMIDTGDEQLEPGTVVTLIGKDGDAEVHTHEIADMLGTIPDDVLSGLNWTIPRSLIKERGADA